MIAFEIRHTVVGDLLVMLDRHFVELRSRSRWALIDLKFFRSKIFLSVLA